MGGNVRANRVHKECPTLVCSKTMRINLVKLPMHDFDVILGMDRHCTRYVVVSFGDECY